MTDRVMALYLMYVMMLGLFIWTAYLHWRYIQLVKYLRKDEDQTSKEVEENR